MPFCGLHLRFRPLGCQFEACRATAAGARTRAGPSSIRRGRGSRSRSELPMFPLGALRLGRVASLPPFDCRPSSCRRRLSNQERDRKWSRTNDRQSTARRPRTDRSTPSYTPQSYRTAPCTPCPTPRPSATPREVGAWRQEERARVEPRASAERVFRVTGSGARGSVRGHCGLRPGPLGHRRGAP